MTLTAAVVVPVAPLLVPALAGADTEPDCALRAEVLASVAWLVAQPQGRLVVVGGAPTTGPVTGTWDWTRLGVRLRGPGAEPALPLGLAVGAWWLQEAGAVADGGYFGVADTEAAAGCAALGQALSADQDVRLLVVGDGSARRSEKAPGHLDARAVEFDRSIEQALADGDTETLLSLDQDLAAALLAAGRAPWQVLAGAVGSRPCHGELRYAGAPLGVGYFVARWLPVGE